MYIFVLCVCMYVSGNKWVIQARRGFSECMYIPCTSKLDTSISRLRGPLQYNFFLYLNCL